MPVTIPSLPVDLIINVVSRLAREDLLQPRLTCRELSYKSDDTFSSVCFKRRQHLYTGRGLEELVIISAEYRQASKIETIVTSIKPR
jgi:hypothetical protein